METRHNATNDRGRSPEALGRGLRLWLARHRNGGSRCEGDREDVYSGICLACDAQPGLEVLERRVERPRQGDIARGAIRVGEIALVLEHVSEVVGAGKSERAIDVGRDRVIGDIDAQRRRERGGHLRAGEVLARDPDGPADELRAALEDAVGAAPDVLHGDRGHRLVVERERDRIATVRSLLRSGAEPDHVLPVERRQQERGRHAGGAEVGVRLALGVEVGDLVLAHERGHAVVIERYAVARVVERRPDHMLQPGALGRSGHLLRLLELALGREMLPEIRQAKRAVGAAERPRHALLIVEIRRDHFRTARGQGARLVAVDMAGQRPHREATLRIVENRPRQTTALGAGGAHNRNHLAHCALPLIKKSTVPHRDDDPKPSARSAWPDWLHAQRIRGP